MFIFKSKKQKLLVQKYKKLEELYKELERVKRELHIHRYDKKESVVLTIEIKSINNDIQMLKDEILKLEG